MTKCLVARGHSIYDDLPTAIKSAKHWIKSSPFKENKSFLTVYKSKRENGKYRLVFHATGRLPRRYWNDSLGCYYQASIKLERGR